MAVSLTMRTDDWAQSTITPSRAANDNSLEWGQPNSHTQEFRHLVSIPRDLGAVPKLDPDLSVMKFAQIGHASTLETLFDIPTSLNVAAGESRSDGM